MRWGEMGLDGLQGVLKRAGEGYGEMTRRRITGRVAGGAPASTQARSPDGMIVFAASTTDAHEARVDGGWWRVVGEREGEDGRGGEGSRREGVDGRGGE